MSYTSDWEKILYLVVSMIAARIYNGESAEEIGLSIVSFSSRKEVLDRYLVFSKGTFDPHGYLAWLQQDEAGIRGEQRPQIIESKSDRECCSESKSPASLSEAVAGLGKSLTALTKTRFAQADIEEQERRYQLCQQCGYLVRERCQLCGCFMKIKTKFKAMKCSAGKW